MFVPRVIPVLLLKEKGLVKTRKFSDPRYIGDPINAVKIFNDLEADELVFLDITASKEDRTISAQLVKTIGEEAYMPFAVGGGIRSLDQVTALIGAGAEKVVINSAAALRATFIEECAKECGNQSIIVSVDVKRSFLSRYTVMIYDGTKKTSADVVAYVRMMESAGAGEILINSIDQDGTMEGYDIDLIKAVSNCVNIPVIACGGAGRLEDLRSAVFEGNASAVAAGSMFVFHGPRRAVLINYPSKPELLTTFKPQAN